MNLSAHHMSNHGVELANLKRAWAGFGLWAQLGTSLKVGIESSPFEPTSLKWTTLAE